MQHPSVSAACPLAHMPMPPRGWPSMVQLTLPCAASQAYKEASARALDINNHTCTCMLCDGKCVNWGRRSAARAWRPGPGPRCSGCAMLCQAARRGSRSCAWQPLRSSVKRPARGVPHGRAGCGAMLTRPRLAAPAGAGRPCLR